VCACVRGCVCVCCVTTKFRYIVINTGNPRIGITNNANHFKHLYPHCCVIGFLTLPKWLSTHLECTMLSSMKSTLHLSVF
jgi:hypothetical protein